MLKVIGLGDNVVDKYEHVRTMYPGGNALNFAVFAKKLGAQAAFLGAFGSDTEGQHVVKSAKTLEIDIRHCKYYNGENGYTRVSLEDGDRVFLGSNKCGVLRTCGLNLTAEDYTYLEQFDIIHSGLYGFAEKELKEMNKRGKTISFDFSNDYTENKLTEILPFVDYSFFSASELSMSDMYRLMIRSVEAGGQFALCTRGVEGAFLYDGFQFYRQKSKLVEPIDTMAAGDSFITCLMVNYLEMIQAGVMKEEAIKDGLKRAADFSSSQCLIDGSFGYGKTY